MPPLSRLHWIPLIFYVEFATSIVPHYGGFYSPNFLPQFVERVHMVGDEGGGDVGRVSRSPPKWLTERDLSDRLQLDMSRPQRRLLYAVQGQNDAMMNRAPYRYERSQAAYWPPSAFNAQPPVDTSSVNDPNNNIFGGRLPDLLTSLSIALINSISTALFPQRQSPGSAPPPQSPWGQGGLFPTFGVSLGPSNQYGNGFNTGVYAGIQGGQSGYNFNYGPYQRPYGSENTNVGGSYGGLSPWPFAPPTVGSTIARPGTPPTENPSVSGTVRSVPIAELTTARRRATTPATPRNGSVTAARDETQTPDEYS